MRNWEILNIALAVLFTFVALRRDTRAIPFLLLAYGSLHFSYAAIHMLAGASIHEVIAIHIQGSGLLAKISSATILAVAFALLVFRSDGYLSRNRNLSASLGGMLALVTAGYLLNLRLDDGMQLRNMVATAAMLVLMMLLAQNRTRLDWRSGKFSILIVISIVTVAFWIAFYEMYVLGAWASFGDSSGEIIYRASSILFNPNLFGIWCAILALGFAYLFHLRIGPRPLMLFAMALAFAGIYLSGSRSAAFILLFLFIGIAISLRAQSVQLRWTPVALMLIVFLSIGAGARWASYPFGERQAGWHAIALLGDRFAIYPIQLGDYLLSRLHLPPLSHLRMPSWLSQQETTNGSGDTDAPEEVTFPAEGVPTEVTASIEGRFKGQLRDSGWLVLYDDAGWLGILSVLGLWAVFGWWGLRTYVEKQDVSSVYALAALLMSLAIGAVMRFQVFPTGLFVALILGPCIGYWRAVPSDKAAEGASQRA